MVQMWVGKAPNQRQLEACVYVAVVSPVAARCIICVAACVAAEVVTAPRRYISVSSFKWSNQVVQPAE